MSMEIMWLREYVHNKESITNDDTDASREKKIEKTQYAQIAKMKKPASR
jgi:hypothetical protein